MTLLLVLEPTRTGWLARRNPVLKLAAATVPSLALLATTDPLTPAILLGFFLAALPLSGLPTRALLRRARPLLLAAVLVGIVNAVFAARQTGRVLLELGPLLVTADSALTGLAITLRVLAIALPGIAVLATTDPVDLADSLVQQLRAPARLAYGTLAALRLLPLLGQEWDAISMARRARGVDSGRSPVAALGLFSSKVLALLVAAIRRGTRLATAMDARGFDAGLVRTHARQQTVAAADVALVVAAVLATSLAVAISVGVGAWRPLLGS